jgi:hypothetical protein
MVFEQAIWQLPRSGKIRLAFDWTIEDDQYLLVISLIQHGRAIPIFWRAYNERVLKKRMKKYERLMLKRVLKRLLQRVSAKRIILTADRGFADVETFRLLKRYNIAFVIRVKSSAMVEISGVWEKLSCIKWEEAENKKHVGSVRYCRSKPESLHVSMARLSESSSANEIWYLVSNRKCSARKLVDEYSRRFGCEEGFRDIKWSLGFSEARIKDIKAWSRMFALCAMAMMALASLGSKLLLGEEGKARKLLRRVVSRRKGKCELSLINVVIALVKQERELYAELNPYIKFNLEKSLQNVS